MKNKKKKQDRIKIKEGNGQASIEYILLLAVVVVILLGIRKKLQNFLVGTGECPSEAFICRIIDQYNGPGLFDSEGRFRQFIIRPRK